MTNFAHEAPKFWTKGLSALPIKPGTKRPAIKDWSSYENALPDEPMQEDWLAKFADHGVGLNLGTRIDDGFALGALDVDDDRLAEPVRVILGDCPSAKVGKKGATFFVRVPVGAKIKSRPIKGGRDLGNVDVLFEGRQTVLPPSVHPETGRPYEWIGPPLCDIELDALPILTERKFAVLQALVQSDHTAVVASGRSTHDAGLALTAQLVTAGAEDNEIMAIFASLLPSGYSGNTLEEVTGWIESARAKGFDDTESAQKDSDKKSKIALNIFEAQGIKLFNDPLGECYAVLQNGDSGAVCHRINSTTVKRFIQHLFYTNTSAPLAAAATKEAVEVLEAKATYDAPTEEVHVRLAAKGGRLFVDIGPGDGRIVEVSGNGWKFVTEAPVNFRRPEGYRAMVAPERCGDPSEIKELLGLDDTSFILFVAFLVNCLNPDGPYMLLLAQGEQGTGKSFLCELIKRIVDPSEVAKMRLPKTEHDLAIQAKTHWVLVFDNAGSVNWDISDALCTLATGGALVTRKYYTDDEARIMKHKRPVIINGIGEFANRPDLLERSVQMNLRTMSEHGRKTEAELNTELERILPGFMGYLFDCVAHAMKNLDSTPTPDGMRMADAAKWIIAAEEATGFAPGSILDALTENQREAMTDRIVNDPLVIALTKVLEASRNRHFEGTVGDLMVKVEGAIGHNPKGIPKTAAHLSNALNRLNPSLRKIGLMVTFGEKTRKGRMVEIHFDDSRAEIEIEPMRFEGGAF